MRWSIAGDSRRSDSWSSSERTRDEWTVAMTHGRRCPASPRAIAAFVPTISARYMWLWTTSAPHVGQVRGEDAGRDRVVGLVDHA